MIIRLKSKKGSTQVDWVISLGIFLLYIAWFFVFITPQFQVEESPEQLLDLAVENILEEIIWKVERRPLFLFSNVTEDNEGIIVDFPFSMQNFAFSDNKTYALDRGKLLFIHNLTGRNIFWIVNSTDNYSTSFDVENIKSKEEYVTLTNFRADFENGLLDEVKHNNKTRLEDFEIYINGIAISRLNNTFNSSEIMASYKVFTENVNHLSYVLANNKVVYNFVEVGKETPHEFTVRAELDQFTNYFSDNANNDFIDYGTDSCDNFVNDYIDFYDSEGGLSFIFDENVVINVCRKDGELFFNATIDLDENLTYHIRAHEGNYIQTQKYELPYYTYRWGIKEVITGIDLDEIEGLSELSYAELRSLLGYPIARQLSIFFEEG